MIDIEIIVSACNEMIVEKFDRHADLVGLRHHIDDLLYGDRRLANARDIGATLYEVAAALLDRVQMWFENEYKPVVDVPINYEVYISKVKTAFPSRI